jgi:predicted O-methyltransferase YrrM
MLSDLKRRWRLLTDLRSERRSLDRLPITAINVAALRRIDAPELSRILNAADIAREWNDVSVQLDQVVQIEDMKTAGVNPGDRRAIYYLIRALRSTRVLEIGSNVGASTLSIAAALKRNIASEHASQWGIVTVDIQDVNDAADSEWKLAKLPRSPRDNLAAIDMTSHVKFETKSSLSYFDDCQERFDLIFLDGDHSARTVYQEVPRALLALRPGGTILLHDYFPGHRPLWNDKSVTVGTSLAFERLQREGAKLNVLPLDRLPWPTKLGSNVTSLAIVAAQ